MHQLVKNKNSGAVPSIPRKRLEANGREDLRPWPLQSGLGNLINQGSEYCGTLAFTADDKVDLLAVENLGQEADQRALQFMHVQAHVLTPRASASNIRRTFSSVENCGKAR